MRFIPKFLFAILLVVGSAVGVHAQALGGSDSYATPSDTSVAVERLSTGWNYFHPGFCFVGPRGTGMVSYVFSREAGALWFVSDVVAQTLVAGACQTGNTVALHLTDAYGTFDMLAVYPH